MKKAFEINSNIMKVLFGVAIAFVLIGGINFLGGGENSLLMAIVALVFAGLLLVSTIVQVILLFACLFEIRKNIES